MNAGINLYSLRNLIKTEKDYIETACALRDMGYTSLQHSGAPFEPETIKKVIKESGLPVVLTHVPRERILNDTDALMREHDSIGCRSIGLGSVPAEDFTTVEGLKRTAEALEGAAAYMAARGFTFFYHHHHREFYKPDGKQTVLSYLAENAPHLHFTFDTYWAQFGGVNVEAAMRALSGRIECVHLKDYKIAESSKTGTLEPTFAPVGEVTLDFPSIVAAARECGTVNFLVEQDNAALMPDSLGEAEKSIKYIKNCL